MITAHLDSSTILTAFLATVLQQGAQIPHAILLENAHAFKTLLENVAISA